MRRSILLIGTLAVGIGAGPAVAKPDDLNPFPPAEAGGRRVVIRVPPVSNAEDRRVEVLPGKTMEVDCNRHLLSARVTRKIAQGWGYPYYFISEVNRLATTRKACPPGTLMRTEFVRANSAELAWLRYDPQMPIVLYVPDGIEIRYRVWRAVSAMEEGKVE